MHGIQAVSAQMIAGCLWFSLFTTNIFTTCGHASHMDCASFPKGRICSPSSTCKEQFFVSLAEPFVLHEYHTPLHNTVPLAGAVFSWAQLSPPVKWGHEATQGCTERVREAIHISRRRWTYSSFCLKGCHFTEPRTERPSTCRYLRTLSYDRIIQEYRRVVYVCSCVLCLFAIWLRYFLRQILHRTSLLSVYRWKIQLMPIRSKAWAEKTIRQLYHQQIVFPFLLLILFLVVGQLLFFSV